MSLFADPEDASPRVPRQLFGLHDGSGSAPDIDSIRLWDDGTRWDQVSPEQGVYNWTRLDENVSAAQARNASEILYVLGSTPKWAASDVSERDYFGAGTASVPRDLSLWRTWVHDVAERYKGRITSYEIWNEANMSAFYSDTPAQLAQLTEIAAKEIRAVDPAAGIVTPSVVLRDGRTGWLAEYLSALRDTGTEVDAIGVHGYVWNDEGPGNGNSDQRRKVLLLVQKTALQMSFTAPLWDTEVNFGNLRDNGWPTYSYPEDRAVTMLARSYVDSQRMGVTRQFWYAWDKQVMSVNLTEASGSVTPVGHAFYRLRRWMADSQWLGCHRQDGVRWCGLRHHGRLAVLVMTSRLHAGYTTIQLGPRARSVCRLDASCALLHSVQVTDTPRLVRLGRPAGRQPVNMAEKVKKRRHHRASLYVGSQVDSTSRPPRTGRLGRTAD